MHRVKFAFLFIFFLLFTLQVYAKGNVAFSLGIKTKIGEHREKVFEKNSLISLLQWQLLPALAFEAGLDLYSKYMHIANVISVSFPAISGKMKDSDYKENIKILFSKHDAHLKEYFSYSSAVGFPFKCSLNSKKYFFVVEPSLGIYFSNIKWHAKNGYTQYEGANGSHFWQDSWPHIDYKGGGVQYSKHIFFAFVALNTKLTILKKWEIDFGFLFSPLLIAMSKDVHFDTGKIYFDNFKLLGFALKPSVEFEYRLHSIISIYWNFSFFLCANNKGSTKVLNKENNRLLASFPKGSAGMSAIEANIIAGVRFWF